MTVVPGFISALYRSIITRGATAPVEAPRVDSEAFSKIANHYREQVGLLADQLASGSITIDEWLTGMIEQVEDVHLTAFIIGKGGIDNMNGADMRVALSRVKVQRGYLERWANELRKWERRGNMPSAEALKARANLYLAASNAAIQDASARSMGLPDLPAYPGDGSTECMVYCKCHWSIRKKKGDGNFDLHWILGSAEHCPNCVRRSETWNPIHVRGGVIVTPIDRNGPLFAHHEDKPTE